jgi:hypothetical protein
MASAQLHPVQQPLQVPSILGVSMSDKLSRFVPLTGVVVVALLVVSAFLPGSMPSSSASGVQIIAYAKAHQNSLNASAFLIGLSLFFGLIFYGQLSGYVRSSPKGERLATISFGGAVLFAAGGGVAGGTSLALADSPQKLDPAAAQALYALMRDLPMILFVGVGVLMFAAGLAIVRSQLLPRWLGYAGIILGVITLLPLGFLALVIGAVWTLAASVAMMLRGPAARDTVVSQVAASLSPRQILAAAHFLG